MYSTVFFNPGILYPINSIAITLYKDAWVFPTPRLRLKKRLGVLDFPFLWKLLQSFFLFFSVLSLPFVRRLPTHNHVMFLLKESGGHYPISRKSHFLLTSWRRALVHSEDTIFYYRNWKKKKKNQLLRYNHWPVMFETAFATIQQ